MADKLRARIQASMQSMREHREEWTKMVDTTGARALAIVHKEHPSKEKKVGQGTRFSVFLLTVKGSADGSDDAEVEGVFRLPVEPPFEGKGAQKGRAAGEARAMLNYGSSSSASAVKSLARQVEDLSRAVGQGGAPLPAGVPAFKELRRFETLKASVKVPNYSNGSLEPGSLVVLEGLRAQCAMSTAMGHYEVYLNAATISRAIGVEDRYIYTMLERYGVHTSRVHPDATELNPDNPKYTAPSQYVTMVIESEPEEAAYVANTPCVKFDTQSAELVQANEDGTESTAFKVDGMLTQWHPLKTLEEAGDTVSTAYISLRAYAEAVATLVPVFNVADYKNIIQYVRTHDDLRIVAGCEVNPYQTSRMPMAKGSVTGEFALHVVARWFSSNMGDVVRELGLEVPLEVAARKLAPGKDVFSPSAPRANPLFLPTLVNLTELHKQFSADFAATNGITVAGVLALSPRIVCIPSRPMMPRAVSKAFQDLAAEGAAAVEMFLSAERPKKLIDAGKITPAHPIARIYDLIQWSSELNAVFFAVFDAGALRRHAYRDEETRAHIQRQLEACGIKVDDGDAAPATPPAAAAAPSIGAETPPAQVSSAAPPSSPNREEQGRSPVRTPATKRQKRDKLAADAT